MNGAFRMEVRERTALLLRRNRLACCLAELGVKRVEGLAQLRRTLRPLQLGSVTQEGE